MIKKIKTKVSCWLLYCKLLGLFKGTWTLLIKQLQIEQKCYKITHRILGPVNYFRVWGLHGLSTLNAVKEHNLTLRLPKSDDVISCRPGSTDQQVFEHIFVEQVYRINLPRNQVKRIVDGGANVGFSTLFFASYFPDSRVVAIEPEVDNIKMLKKNTNNHDQIEILSGALWSYSGKVFIQNPKAAAWSFRVSDALIDDNQEVSAYGVDDILEQFDWNGIDLIKLDVEGAEREIFSDPSAEWLGKVGCIICELHESKVPGCIAAFETAMTRNAFDVIYFKENAIAVKLEWFANEKRFSSH